MSAQRALDARDLAILGLAAAGYTIAEIARVLHIKRRVVRRVLAEDMREFPDEPLSPQGAC